MTFTTVIAACAAARDASAALEVLDGMRTSPVAVPTRACNAALSACERAGRWQAALALLESMETCGPPPDAVSVRSAVFACCGAVPGPPRVSEAKALFRRCAPTSVVCYGKDTASQLDQPACVCCVASHVRTLVVWTVVMWAFIVERGVWGLGRCRTAAILHCRVTKHKLTYEAAPDRIRHERPCRVAAGEVAGVPSNALSYNILVRACDVDVVGSASAQAALLAGFLAPDGAASDTSLATAVTGPGGLEAMAEAPGAVAQSDLFSAPPFVWPPDGSGGAAGLSEEGHQERQANAGRGTDTAGVQNDRMDAIKAGISLVAHEKGFQRRPKNKCVYHLPGA